MNSKAIDFLKNFFYTLSSNLLSLIISSVVVLIIPKLISVEEYGYWQLYLFYISYVGFLHFGWNDGIYLRYGGDRYESLDKGLFFSQFYMLLISQLIIAMIIIAVSPMLTVDNNRLYIIKMISLSLIITNVRHMLLYIMQSTNRIKEYAQVTMIGRIVYFLVIILMLLIGIREYKLMIFADIFGRFTSLLLAMYFCKAIVFRKISSFRMNIQEMLANINVGIKLMFANIASMLIIGTVRFGIERSWDVETFGKVSLTLSASNLMMLFINAVGIIIYPILRRTDAKKLPDIYTIMRDFLMVALLGLLIAYYPLKTILTAWLPKYSESLMYMALVFPMFIYEGKMALLINTYLKTLRKERSMLIINLATLSLSLITTLFTTRVLGDLDLAIISIVILLAFRSILAEVILSNMLKISMAKDIILELTLTVAFILSGWFINSWYTVLVYGLAYIAYLLIKRKDIASMTQSIKLLMKA